MRGIGTMSGRRGRTSTVKARVSSQENKIDDLTTKVQDLEDELAQELTDLDAQWNTVAATIEPVEIGLEKTDISVAQVAVVWVAY